MKNEIIHGFFSVMGRLPKPKLSAKETLALWIKKEREFGLSLKAIAAKIDEQLEVRTVEYWAQERSLPREWVCALILQKLGIPFRR
ncbi:MAG TPA: hypothetical protein VIM48_00610 [Chthoniobacterales bacterium]